MDNNYCVYMHTVPDGRVYIGMTKYGENPYKRWKNGTAYLDNLEFTKAIKHYGWDNISHEIIANGLTVTQAEKIEIETIRKHNACNSLYGFNRESGGLSAFTQHPEAKMLSSISHTGKKHTIETKEKIRQWHLGTTLSDETKQKISRKATGRHLSEETKAKLSEIFKNRYISEESCAKISSALKGRTLSDDNRKFLSDLGKVTRNRKKRVMCIETGQIFESAREASLSLGLNKGAITTTIYYGNNRTCGGFHWKYIDKGVEEIMAISEDNTKANVIMPRELKKRLMSYAEKENRSLSNLIVTILMDYLETHKEG